MIVRHPPNCDYSRALPAASSSERTAANRFRAGTN